VLPPARRWLFWDVDVDGIDVQGALGAILPRVLERGRLEDVEWALATYGEDRVHAFLRDVGHVELSPKTIAFWRAYFRAGDEPWKDPSACRPSSSAPWIG
jgi:hypothetical protein